MSPDPKTRFSNRVEDYARYRPSYPPAVIDHLKESVGLESSWTIADIGCGTGISSESFLNHGNPVLGIEPNREMRISAATRFAACDRFRPIDASAESTTLPDSSVDLIVAAQAFHWFDHAAAKTEFLRIL